MDDDVLPEKYWLEEMVKVAESDDKIGAVQANLRTPDNIIHIWKGEANPFTVEPTEIQDIGYACTALTLYKYRVIKEVGYFDENFLKWSFDTDYSWRIKERGYRVVVAPKAKAIHLASQTVSKDPRKQYYDVHDRIYLIKKWFLTNRFKPEYSDNNLQFIEYWRKYTLEQIKKNE